MVTLSARPTVSILRSSPARRPAHHGLRPRTLAALVGIAVASTAGAQDEPSSRLEEIVVSATRRDQSVLEIPYNISALKGEDLVKLGVSDFTSIARHVPGLVATDAGARNNGTNSSFIIRGINASTVGGGAFQIGRAHV